MRKVRKVVFVSDLPSPDGSEHPFAPVLSSSICFTRVAQKIKRTAGTAPKSKILNQISQIVYRKSNIVTFATQTALSLYAELVSASYVFTLNS